MIRDKEIRNPIIHKCPFFMFLKAWVYISTQHSVVIKYLFMSKLYLNLFKLIRCDVWCFGRWTLYTNTWQLLSVSDTASVSLSYTFSLSFCQCVCCTILKRIAYLPRTEFGVLYNKYQHTYTNCPLLLSARKFGHFCYFLFSKKTVWPWNYLLI